MGWLVVLIIAIVIGAIWGFLSSKDGERGEGALGGGFAAGVGCGYILFQIFLWGIGLLILIWLFGALFG